MSEKAAAEKGKAGDKERGRLTETKRVRKYEFQNNKSRQFLVCILECCCCLHAYFRACYSKGSGAKCLCG